MRARFSDHFSKDLRRIFPILQFVRFSSLIAIKRYQERAHALLRDIGNLTISRKHA